MENHYAEGTLRKFGHFGENGPLVKMSVRKGHLVKIGAFW